ncbi:hypothetical protein BDZ89DRAFT_1060898 [Hymenopellis radicata]|nr:hypothetical protein BDZ89DRAFT_1060898 [Hymenopellis radicata]
MSSSTEQVYDILQLPEDVAREIIYCATQVTGTDTRAHAQTLARKLVADVPSSGMTIQQAKLKRYETALQLTPLCRALSPWVRRHILHTVILASLQDLQQFLNSYYEEKSKGGLNYSTLVKRVWCSEFFNIITSQSDLEAYGALFYEIIRGAQALGMTADSANALPDCLETANPARDCAWKRLTITDWEGHCIRWNPFKNGNGPAFLARITHLCMWTPYHGDSPDESCPTWLRTIPFNLMPNLEHFAFPLLTWTVNGPSYMRMFVYSNTPVPFMEFAKRAAAGSNFVNHGRKVKLEVVPEAGQKMHWKVGYILDEVDRVWGEVQKNK